MADDPLKEFVQRGQRAQAAVDALTPPRVPTDPSTPDEWQAAVTAAHFLLLVDSARQYGLVTFKPTINVARCGDLLERGRALGYKPREQL